MDTLPIELLYRIFDDVDIETILFSIRRVSKLFASIVNTYDRFVFNPKLITKANFYLLCRWIKPQNVISLILSNDKQTPDQIDLFLSYIRLGEFTRLQSLTLLQIDEGQLNFILERINLNRLTSFSFTIRNYSRMRMNKTNNLLTSILRHRNLYKLDFDMKNERMSEFSWLFNCSIQSLTINNHTTIDNLIRILQSSSHLHTIVIKKKFDEQNMMNRILDSSSLQCFHQLKSFTIEELNINRDQLESFLSLTPSLIDLKLIGGNKILDGKRWELFIERNLPYLNKFQFFFEQYFAGEKSLTDLKLILASYQTPFWIKHKKWFVTCEYDIHFITHVHLYSIPLCKTSLQYNPIWKQLSTCIEISERELTMMNNIKSLGLILDKVLVNDLKEKVLSNQPLFPNVTDISLQFCKTGPLFPLESLSMIINISQIVQLEFTGYFFDLYENSLFTDIDIFLQQTHSLSSLTIVNISKERIIMSRILNGMHSILPIQLKHLRIPINSQNQMKIIFDRCQKLSTIICDIQVIHSDDIIQWINDNTIDSTYKQDDTTVTVWIGKKMMSQSNGIQIENKRRKLTENQFDLI